MRTCTIFKGKNDIDLRDIDKSVFIDHIKRLYGRFQIAKISKVLCSISTSQIRISPPKIKMVNPAANYNAIKDESKETGPYCDTNLTKAKELLKKIFPICNFIKDAYSNDYVTFRTSDFFNYIIEYYEILKIHSELFIFDQDISNVKESIDYSNIINSIISINYDFKYLIEIPLLGISFKLYNTTLPKVNEEVDAIIKHLETSTQHKKDDYLVAKEKYETSLNITSTAKVELVYVKLPPKDESYYS